MKKFKNLFIPDKIVFNKWLEKRPDLIDCLIGDSQRSCELLTNSEHDVDPWKGITYDKRCAEISCCQCIYSGLNAEKRIEYFKSLQK